MEVAEDTASDEAEDAIVMVDGDDDKGNECYELCFQNVRNETLDCIKKLSGCRIWGSRTNLKTCGKSDTFIRNLANPIPIRSQVTQGHKSHFYSLFGWVFYILLVKSDNFKSIAASVQQMAKISAANIRTLFVIYRSDKQCSQSQSHSKS